jgi:hypothetical protein
VLRIGSGVSGVVTNSLTTFIATPLFIDEIIPSSGAIRRSIAMPTAANGNQRACTLSASARLVEGLMVRTDLIRVE